MVGGSRVVHSNKLARTKPPAEKGSPLSSETPELAGRVPAIAVLVVLKVDCLDPALKVRRRLEEKQFGLGVENQRAIHTRQPSQRGWEVNLRAPHAVASCMRAGASYPGAMGGENETLTIPRRLPDGRLRIPRTVELPGLIGDAVVDIGPDDPDYAEWDAWIRGQGR